MTTQISRRTLLGTVPLLALLAACSQAEGDSSARSGTDAVVWGKPADLTEYDPATSGAGLSWQIFFLVYDQLLNTDDDLKVVPGLAESWEQPNDTTYVFRLRAGATFSNGRAVTPADVVGSFERLLDKTLGASWTGQLGPVTKVEASGTDQVTFTLSKPYTPFLAAVAHVSTSILPIAELDAKTFDPSKELLGSGAYRVVSHTQDQAWEFAANDHYWRAGQPVLKKLRVKIFSDENAQIAALRDGSINLANFESVDSPALLKKVENVTTVVQQSTDYYVLQLNEKGKSKLKDARVRRALAIALDREKIRDVALAGVGEPTSATPPGFPGTVDPADLPTSKQTLDEAKALIAAAGAEGLQFELLAASTFPTFALIAQVLKEQWAQIGVTATISKVDAGAWQQRVFTDKPGDFDASITYFAGYGDPSLVVGWWNPTASVWNDGALEPDARLNTFIDATRSTPEGAARDQAFRDAVDLIDTDAGMIPLVTRPVIIGFRSDVLDAKVATREGYIDTLRGVASWSSRA